MTEEKVRLAFWGISDLIWKTIQNEINPRNTEIVTFIDNDVTKQKTEYNGIPVSSLEEFDEKKVDYIIIAALSAYEDIKEQILRQGVDGSKVQVYATERLCNYCIGKIDDIDYDLVKRIYFRPDKALESIKKYSDIYIEYRKSGNINARDDEWFMKGSLISHALGGYVNGKELMYSNSKEAFSYSVSAGFKLIECDVLGIIDGEWMLGNDYWRYYESMWENYTLVTLKDLLYMLAEHEDVSCLMDVKWDVESEYFACVDEIERIIDEMSADACKKGKLKAQIVMEVYNEDTIMYAREKSFQMIFTQYKNPEWQCFMNTANLCAIYGVGVIAIDREAAYAYKKFLKIILDKGIRIFVFSTDSMEEYFVFKKWGIQGVFTNYLKP